MAAVGLHHAIAEAHYIDGLVKFCLAFFALWWPWMSHTWFASAFDNDNAIYRISAMIMMFGVILIAGSLPGFFESLDIRLMTIGYVVLRLPFIFLWYRVGKTNPEYAKTAKIISGGQIVLQIFWVTLAFLIPFGNTLFFILFGLGVIAELMVPYLGYRAKNPPYHKHHIMERFGLLNIIVLGEVLLSSALAIQAMSKSGHWTADLIFVAIAAVIVPFALWWLYFNEDENLNSDDMNHVFVWSYAHYFIFASAAAIGAGFADLVDASGDHPHGDPDSARWAINLAVAIYIYSRYG
ncbi:MAG: low temperature requirement protein LtrA [Cocleimonas sp.]